MTKPGDRFFAFLSTGFGFGYSPVVPGTVGTLPAVAFFVLAEKLLPSGQAFWATASALAVSCIVSVPLGYWAERRWGEEDPRRFVLDEIAGFLLTVLLFRGESLVAVTVAAFIATRFFDVVKPPPVFRLQRLPGGWGILIDDLAASLYAVVCLYAIAWVFPALFRS
jgi:phosphatidylglycerophosphatase A